MPSSGKVTLLVRSALCADTVPISFVFGGSIPSTADRRYLVLSQSGEPLIKSRIDTAGERFLALATKEGVIDREQRFSLHRLKHRGVTDTKGTRSQKKDASGHKSNAAFTIYDDELQVVEPAGKG